MVVREDQGVRVWAADRESILADLLGQERE
jgi:hypothetical protein